MSRVLIPTHIGEGEIRLLAIQSEDIIAVRVFYPNQRTILADVVTFDDERLNIYEVYNGLGATQPIIEWAKAQTERFMPMYNVDPQRGVIYQMGELSYVDADRIPVFERMHIAGEGTFWIAAIGTTQIGAIHDSKFDVESRIQRMWKATADQGPKGESVHARVGAVRE